MSARSIFVGVAILAATPADAWVQSGPTQYSFQDLQMFHRQHLKELREEVLAQQQADGGTLSSASATRFQNKLDALNHQYQITLRRYDPFSVNGFGMPIARTYPQ